MAADILGGCKEGWRGSRSCGDRRYVYGNYYERDASTWAEASVSKSQLELCPGRLRLEEAGGALKSPQGRK